MRSRPVELGLAAFERSCVSVAGRGIPVSFRGHALTRPREPIRERPTAIETRFDPLSRGGKSIFGGGPSVGRRLTTGELRRCSDEGRRELAGRPVTVFGGRIAQSTCVIALDAKTITIVRRAISCITRTIAKLLLVVSFVPCLIPSPCESVSLVGDIVPVDAGRVSFVGDVVPVVTGPRGAGHHGLVKVNPSSRNRRTQASTASSANRLPRAAVMVLRAASMPSPGR